MTNPCEHHETQVSAWLDGELERAGQVELLDHLARCGPCRGFYLEARALDGLMAIAGSRDGGEEAAPELWEGIAHRAAERDETGTRRRLPSRVWKIAATVLLAAGLALLLWPSRPADVVPVAADTPSDEIEILLEEDSGRMSESRFVELASEVLRADRKYHFAMYEVMDQVIRDTGGQEGTAEPPPSEGEREEEQGEREGEGGKRLRA